MNKQSVGPAATDNPEPTPHAWKATLESNFRDWLHRLDEIPGDEESVDGPDLYSFYEELCVLRNEFGKNARRSHETFSRFGDSLASFQDVMQSLSARLERLARDEDAAGRLLNQELFLRIVEMYDRLNRLLLRLDSPGADTESDTPGMLKRIWNVLRGKTSPEDAPLGSLREGIAIVVSHFEALLDKEGISKIKTEGSLFNPLFMTAVGTVAADDHGPGMVVEEIAGGYLYGETILKLAAVTVSK
ncbi:MAG: nucleotide exchange factor GrpE [Pseudomonadota bacterium]